MKGWQKMIWDWHRGLSVEKTKNSTLEIGTGICLNKANKKWKDAWKNTIKNTEKTIQR